MSNACINVRGLGVILGILFCFNSVQAAVLEEVVVTAQKREQSIQDVGISISALSGSDMKTLGMQTTTDLSAHMPGVQMFNALGGPGQNVSLAIRGVGLNDFQDGTEAPSVIYSDEFYVLPLAGASVAMFDLDRVEALRGPQGTLFGRNATGGLIHFISRKPSDEFEGYVDLTLAEYDQINVEGAVNIPILDNLATRFAFITNNNDGWQDNILPQKDGGETDWWAVRNQWAWQATDDLDVLLKFEYSKARGDTGYYQHLPAFVDADGAARAVPSNTDIYGTCPGCGPTGYREEQSGAGDAFDTKVANQDLQRLSGTRATTVTGKITWDAGGIEVTSVSGYLNLSKDNREDCDSAPFDICRTRYAYDQEEFTQELRFHGETDRTRWTTGFYYLHQSADNKQDAALDADGFLGFTGIPGVPFILDNEWESELNAWAVFGQLEFDISDKWSVIAGLRYSDDDKEFEQVKQDFIADPATLVLPDGTLRNQDFAPFPGLPLFGGVNFTRNGAPFGVDADFDLVAELVANPAGDLVDQSFKNVNAKIELDWRPTDDMLMYASFSRGTKSGGFNNGFIGGLEVGATNANVPFDEEVLHAWELGIKSTFWGGKARLNAAAFYYDYSDYHAFSFLGLASVTTNADASLYGAEFELFLNPIERLDMMFGLSLLDTEVEDISNGVTVSDKEMGLAPDITFNGLARYEWPALNGMAGIQADFSYVDERHTDVQNQPVQLLESYVIGNARASWRTNDDRWEVGLFVNNIGDVQVPSFIFNLASLGYAQINMSQRPRWFGGSVSYRWF